MKKLVTALFIAFSISGFAQERKIENEKMVNPVSILDEVMNLEIFTFNYEENPEERHYTARRNEQHESFGKDGIGKIDRENNLSNDDLFYITLAALKGLKLRNDQLEMNVMRLEEEVRIFREMNETGIDPIVEIENLKQRLEELNMRLEELSNATKQD